MTAHTSDRELLALADEIDAALPIAGELNLLEGLCRQASLFLRATPVWRPISTAPKDGTKIDIWFYFSNEHSARWTDCYWNDGYWVNGPPSQYEDGWVATHWMPLPAAPQEGTEP